jgi:hypothetical protein
MKDYITYEDLMQAPETVQKIVMSWLQEEAGSLGITIERHFEDNDYDISDGNSVSLVETDEDLAQVTTGEPSKKRPGEYAGLDEVAYDGFAWCNWTADGKYVYVVWNGPVGAWFIPKEIAERNPNVLESIRISSHVNFETWEQEP